MTEICSDDLFVEILNSFDRDEWGLNRHCLAKTGTDLEIWVANMPFFDWSIHRPRQISFTMSQKVRLINPMRRMLKKLNPLLKVWKEASSDTVFNLTCLAKFEPPRASVDSVLKPKPD